ncbi:hypothetical protein [Rheinheimera sp.]|uniref:hypothetical protein n=1 Tax=Rheinheimera sp. TaxID=1869214 RepID=UPI002FDE27B8
MQNSALEHFISQVKTAWSGLNTETVESVRQLLINLTRAAKDEPWFKDMLSGKPAAKELYRDPEHGFILLAHTEEKGTYRQPHNHGAGWVFYAVLSGEMAMRTYQQVTTVTGETHLVSRGTDLMQAGQCRVFLPGDIHDTRCLSDAFVQLRLTSTDFQKEMQEGRLVRFSSPSAAPV